MRYEFTLILRDYRELTPEVADALYEAGCDDGTPGTCDGVLSIDFHREGDALEAAIKSAIADLHTAGYSVSRVEMDAMALCT